MEILFIAGALVSITLSLFAWRQTRRLARPGAPRVVVPALLLLAALFIGFAFWGQYTPSGARAFDEMDGLYPLAAGPLGTLLAAIAALTAWIAGRRRGPDG